METLTLDVVVEEIAAQLAERRQAARGRRQAYVALARAILAEEFDADAAVTDIAA